MFQDIALGLDVVNSRQDHLSQRVSIENEKFYKSEEQFNIAEAIQKTKYVNIKLFDNEENNQTLWITNIYLMPKSLIKQVLFGSKTADLYYLKLQILTKPVSFEI